MADVIARLQVDSSQYDGKLKKAVEQMTNMEKEVRRTGATFEFADKAEMEFVKSLGSLETSSTSAKTKMMEYTNAIASLTATYRAMTDEEKQSDFGKGLSSSIDELKAKAATLKDIMSDTNIEIKNLASDTSFTDGIGLMTRTVGSCAAAITAWTGDSKEMEVVIKDLAKIGATVSAIDSLTKAFQKQNLVLLKNPYVAAAAAVVALGVAIGKIIKSTTELSETQKALNEVQQKGMENSAQEVTRIETLNNILHDNTRSLEERKTALNEIQNLVPDYHGALTEEGNLINDNTDVLDDYVVGLQKAAAAQAAFDKMVEVQKRKLAKQLKLQEAQGKLDAANKASENAKNLDIKNQNGGLLGQGGAMQGMSGMIQTAENDRMLAQRAVEKLQADIKEDQKVLDNLGTLVDAKTLGSGTKTTRTTGGNRGTGGKPKPKPKPKPTGGGSGTTIKPEEVLPEGSIAAIEKRISELQDKFSKATTQEAREAINADITALEEQLKGMRIEPKVEIPEGSMAALKEQLQELQKQWDLAANDDARSTIKAQIEEVTAAIKEMEGEVEKVTTASDMWKDHAAKIEETKARLAEFQAMMGDTSLSEDQRNWAKGMAESYQEELNEMMGATEEAANNMSSKFEMVKESLDHMSTGVGAISTLGNSLNDLKGIGDDLAEAFSGEMNTWDALMSVFNSGIGIMQTVISVMEAINTLQELSSALSKKKVIDQGVETAAVVAGKGTEAAATTTEMGIEATATGITAGKAAASAGDAVAGIPIVGPVLAVAAVAAVLAAILASVSKAKSSAGKFASGGVVGGNSYSGDRLMAYVNSGETILTPQQADKAMNGIEANKQQGGGASSSFVTGENIVLGVNNFLGRSGQGEIVTTSMLRRAGVNL